MWTHGDGMARSTICRFIIRIRVRGMQKSFLAICKFQVASHWQVVSTIDSMTQILHRNARKCSSSVIPKFFMPSDISHRYDCTKCSYNGSLGSFQISYSIALTFRLIDSYSRNEEFYFSYLQISGGIAWCFTQSIMHRYDDSFGSTPGSTNTASAILKYLTLSIRFFG